MAALQSHKHPVEDCLCRQYTNRRLEVSSWSVGRRGRIRTNSFIYATASSVRTCFERQDWSTARRNRDGPGESASLCGQTQPSVPVWSLRTGDRSRNDNPALRSATQTLHQRNRCSTTGENENGNYSVRELKKQNKADENALILSTYLCQQRKLLLTPLPTLLSVLSLDN